MSMQSIQKTTPLNLFKIAKLMKPDFMPIVKEYERQSEIEHKGRRLFSDEYIIYSLSLRFGKSEKKIKEILNLH